MQDVLIKGVASVKSSTHRANVLNELVRSLRTPAEIASSLKMELSHVSKALICLKEGDLVTCLNENDRKTRIYQITDKGKQVLKIIKDNSV